MIRNGRRWSLPRDGIGATMEGAEPSGLPARIRAKPPMPGARPRESCPPPAKVSRRRPGAPRRRNGGSNHDEESVRRHPTRGASVHRTRGSGAGVSGRGDRRSGGGTTGGGGSGGPPAAQPPAAHGAGVFRGPGARGGARRPARQGGTPHPGRRRGVRTFRTGEDPVVLRPSPRENPTQPARHRGGGARRLPDRKRDLREPAGVPGDRQSVRTQGPLLSAARRGGILRPLRQRQGGRDLPGLFPGAGATGVRRSDLRPHRPGRADAVHRRKPPASAGRRHRRAPVRRKPAVPGGRVLRNLAGLGRNPRPGLPAHPGGGRSESRRNHRQLRGRNHGDLAVRAGGAVDHGGAQLLRDHVPPEPGERAARRHRAVSPPGALPGTRPRRLFGGHGAQACDGPGAGKGLLRRPRRRGGVRAPEAPLRAFRRGGQRRPVHRSPASRLQPGEPRGHVPLVQPGDGYHRRVDRAGAGDGGG
jgi:hypothetical protein